MRAGAARRRGGRAARRAPRPPTEEQLGALLFEDRALSNPPGQACADCHAATRAFRDPESDHSTSVGAIAGRFGPRNAPTLDVRALRAAAAPRRRAGSWVGGLFWDGRANSLEEQAELAAAQPARDEQPRQGDAWSTHVRRASYARNVPRRVRRRASLDDVDQAFAAIASALAAYERGPSCSRRSRRSTIITSPAATAHRRGAARARDLRGSRARQLRDAAIPSRPGRRRLAAAVHELQLREPRDPDLPQQQVLRCSRAAQPRRRSLRRSRPR